MKKIFTLFLSVLMVFTMAGCGSNDIPTTGGKGTTTTPKFPSDMNQSAITDPTTQTPDDDTSAPNVSDTPQTVMDLFKGERKLWYVISGDMPRHDSNIQAVIVTEDSKTVDFYYYDATNCLKMSDLNEKNDDEILNQVQQRYYSGINGFQFNDSTLKVKLPQEITYEGRLDATGNQLEDEFIIFFDPEMEQTDLIIHSKVPADETIMPTVVEETEYVGIGSSMTSVLTKNIYSEFEYLGLDSPDGATKTY